MSPQTQNNNLSLHTLRNAHGLRAEITNLGGRVVSLFVPDKDGTLRDVVLGFENLSDYLPENHRSDFGAAIGRYANRLKNGQITVDIGSCNSEDAVASISSAVSVLWSTICSSMFFIFFCF